jgi:uncharacterized damage-inducible protein DinB
MKHLCNANIDVLNQLKRLIQHCETIYLKDPSSHHAGIGQHVRHVLDHYRAFEQGLDQQCVDYNLRTRDSAEENDPLVAAANINKLIQWFASLDVVPNDITVISEISLREQQSEAITSNAERELLYLINHSIHHMAYASLLASSKNVFVPRDIGLAPGTATYERNNMKESQHETA